MVSKYERMDGIIVMLSQGDPERLDRYRREHTHTEIAEAWLARLINE